VKIRDIFKNPVYTYFKRKHLNYNDNYVYSLLYHRVIVSGRNMNRLAPECRSDLLPEFPAIAQISFTLRGFE
jgi:hypothetical protein